MILFTLGALWIVNWKVFLVKDDFLKFIDVLYEGIYENWETASYFTIVIFTTVATILLFFSGYYAYLFIRYYVMHLADRISGWSRREKRQHRRVVLSSVNPAMLAIGSIWLSSQVSFSASWMTMWAQIALLICGSIYGAIFLFRTWAK